MKDEIILKKYQSKQNKTNIIKQFREAREIEIIEYNLPSVNSDFQL